MVPLTEAATDDSTPAPNPLRELADEVFAKMDLADDPALPDDARDDLVEACGKLLERAASTPATNHADLALKLEMLAHCRCWDGPVDEELLESALGDAVRLSDRLWPKVSR
jgi:hypothetical protein